MRRRTAWTGCWVLAAGLLSATPAQALITQITPLRNLLADSQYVLAVRVDSIDAGRPAMVLTADADLKGKAAFRRLPINLTGDADAVKKKQTEQLLRRVAPKLPLVLFVNERDKNYTAFGYTNGTWFQLAGVQTDGGVRWRFTHLEPYLRKTYKGTTAELRQVVEDVLAGKRKAPPPDKKEKPGLGPEVKSGEKSSGSARPQAATGPVFAVIPSVLIGGPLAVLAMLFPAVFGGLMLVLRRWMAALSVLSLNSTLYLAQGWFAPRLANTWAGTPLALWLTMTVVTLLGVLWAWRRHLTRVGSTLAQPFEGPGRLEVATLVLLSILSAAAAAWWLPRSLSKLDLWDKTLLVFGAGLWAATLHALWLRSVSGRRGGGRPGLPGEGVMLWTMLLAGTLLGATFTQETMATTGPGADDDTGPYRVVWRFKPTHTWWVASSPCIDGDRLFVGVVQSTSFTKSGAVYCLDRNTGKLLWSFNDGGKMKEVFSSPAAAGGRVYVGEGFHQDVGCKLYCLDADSGKKVWEFQTGSHTESSPCVVGGKVYFGAGDDGLYCVDAATGKQVWRHEGYHIDSNPLVAGGRLYAGSGVGDQHRDTFLFCLDAQTGKEHWRLPTDLPVWGMPAVDGDRLYAPIGNGTFGEDDAEHPPAGAVLCLDVSGPRPQRLWRFDARNGVHTRVLADAGHIYFGSRDGHCYCVDRKKGELVWKRDMGSPVVASPELFEADGRAGLYVLASAGAACRLNVATGAVEWTFDVQKDMKEDPVLYSSPALVVSPGPRGERRRIYFGAGSEDRRKGVIYCLEDRGQ